MFSTTAEMGSVFGATMAPMMIAVPDDAAIDNIVAYLETLPSEPPEHTVFGDVEEGERIYANCGSCHGADGRGLFTMNAPGLAEMTDWYLVRQLENFQNDIRGTHRDDLYGHQMILLTGMLRDEQAIADVIAYINTL